MVKKFSPKYIVIFAFYTVLLATLLYGILMNIGFIIYQSLLITVTVGILHILQLSAKFQLPWRVFNFIILFVFLSMYMGKIFVIYSVIPYYDKWLHLISGMILVPLGYAVFQKLCKNRINLCKKIMLPLLFSLLFAISAAAIWEIFEFSSDNIIGTNCQNNSLDDTMLDMIFGTIGALISGIGLKYLLKKRRRGL